MAKLHHLTLKAAVAKYLTLGLEEKTEAEIKAVISLDEKQFDEDEIGQIYEAIQSAKAEQAGSIIENVLEIKPDEGVINDTAPDPEPEKEKEKEAYIVVVPFRDIQDFSKAYNVGDDISHFKPERLENLVKNGLCSNDK